MWIHLPLIVYGGVSFLSALLALRFPETLNQPLPQTVEDVEQMKKNKRTKKTPKATIQLEEQTNQQNRVYFHRF